ncbi:MAG: hypothetical protein ACXADH_13960 [Candidatus Kariarchaeaceae archaeon]
MKTKDVSIVLTSELPIHAHVQIICDKLEEYQIQYTLTEFVELYENCFLVKFEDITSHEPIEENFLKMKNELPFLNKNTSFYNSFKKTMNIIIQLNDGIEFIQEPELNQDPNLVMDKSCSCGCIWFIKDPEKEFIRACKDCARPRFGQLDNL